MLETETVNSINKDVVIVGANALINGIMKADAGNKSIITQTENGGRGNVYTGQAYAYEIEQVDYFSGWMSIYMGSWDDYVIGASNQWKDKNKKFPCPGSLTCVASNMIKEKLKNTTMVGNLQVYHCQTLHYL